MASSPFADAPLPLGPSHGDFSPWNVFYDGAAPPGILDFEHYAPDYPTLFDDCHWLVGTLARRAVRHGFAAALVALAPRLPGLLWNVALKSRHGSAFAHPHRLLATALCGYLVALGAMFELQRSGLQLPRDMSVMGFDHISWSEHSHPRLTCISLPVAAMGEESAQAICNFLADGTPIPSVRLQGEIRIRGSTCPPPSAAGTG